MKALLTKLTRFSRKLVWGLVPSKLPIGMPALEKFSNEIIDAYSIPNLPSYHHAIASMIMHLGQTQTTVKKSYLAKSIFKAMSNQVCFERIQQIKEQEKADAEQPKG